MHIPCYSNLFQGCLLSDKSKYIFITDVIQITSWNSLQLLIIPNYFRFMHLPL